MALANVVQELLSLKSLPAYHTFVTTTKVLDDNPKVLTNVLTISVTCTGQLRSWWAARTIERHFVGVIKSHGLNAISNVERTIYRHKYGNGIWSTRREVVIRIMTSILPVIPTKEFQGTERTGGLKEEVTTSYRLDFINVREIKDGAQTQRAG